MESFVINARRRLHEYPEIGFELDKTLAFLRSSLDEIGVEYTEKYGKSSIVATVNPEKRNFTIAIRADIDALPINEKNDVPYKSRIEGQMHACGHDAHTAIALDVCRRIYEMRDKVACRVKFFFQSAEEYPPSGAKLMVADGVMEDVDCIVALHCDSAYLVGEIGISEGAQSAVSDGFYLDFFGKSAHAAQQQKGVDAIMMAVRAYTDIEFMIAKEISARDSIVFNVGAINGGVANNIICPECRMYCTMRTLSTPVRDYAMERIKRIIEGVAQSAGGKATLTMNKHYPMVVNDKKVSNLLIESAKKVVGEEFVLPRVQSMGGEDFSYFLCEKPGCMFRLGIKNEEKGITYPVHTDMFDIDESALQIGSDVFVRFILDNMNGFES